MKTKRDKETFERYCACMDRLKAEKADLLVSLEYLVASLHMSHNFKGDPDGNAMERAQAAVDKEHEAFKRAERAKEQRAAKAVLQNIDDQFIHSVQRG